MKTNFVKSKKYLQITLLLNLVLFANCVLPVNVSAQKTVDKKLTPREIAQQTLPSTVLLVMGNSDTEEVKSGSGFFVAEDIVVTNLHVIKEMTKGYAKIYGQEKIHEILGIVGTDEKNDLALLKIKGIKGKALKLNADDSAAIGDEVFAVGNPKGLEGTFSQGIVSSIRKIGKFNLLQITASISSGSSGGAVLNDKGEVIGVAVGAIESGQSLNFAIPISLLRSLISNQKPIKSLESNVTIAENKVQPNQKIETKQPNKIPAIKTAPQRKSKAQFKTPDLTEENLFGKVKSIKESRFAPEKKFDEWILGEPAALVISQYNVDGYKENLELTLLSDRGFILNDDYWMFYLLDKDPPTTRKSVYFYDYPNGVETQEFYEKCGSCSSFIFKRSVIRRYRENEITVFDKDGIIHSKQITFDKPNGLTITETYDKEGQLSIKQSIYQSKTGKIKETRLYEKNKKGETKTNLLKVIITEAQGRLKETSICANGKEVECGFIEMDSTTKLIIRRDSGTEILKYEYKFDQTGNWIEKTEYKQVVKFGKTFFEPINVWKREITYY